MVDNNNIEYEEAKNLQVELKRWDFLLLYAILNAS